MGPLKFVNRAQKNWFLKKNIQVCRSGSKCKREKMKGGSTAGGIQQVCVEFCMIRQLHRKFLTLRP